MPTPPKLSRIVLIDSLRGFALAGVALVHFTQRYITYATPESFLNGVNSIPDYIVNGLVQLFFVGKSYALFSLLFGLSFTIQMQSAEHRGENFSLRFLWRAALLFVIGYGHHLFYGGDILTMYALLAPFIIPFYKLNNKWLLMVAGMMFIGLPSLLTLALIGDSHLFGMPWFEDFASPINQEMFHAFQSGSLSDVFRVNTLYGMKMQYSFQLISGRLYNTYGYFLLGLFLGKIGLFRNVDSYIPYLKKSIKWSLISFPVIIGIGILVFWLATRNGQLSSRWDTIIGMTLYNLINIPFSIIILSGFILLYQKSKWQKRLSYFAPYGRMALTNYVSQAIVGSFILCGWGLGLCDHIRTLYLFIIAIGLVIVQTYACRIWLNTFRYGPLEWLWRSGTYLKVQPFRKE
ncbi:MAG TPA: DUF418 domain-containing protein [Bacteroidales bacterium]|nr:DUF418 domain-containing protein [Bacteroidales bacterium]